MNIDWNGDGKYDHYDDAFIHTVLYSDDDSPKLDPAEKWSPSDSGPGWILGVIAIIVISFFFF